MMKTGIQIDELTEPISKEQPAGCDPVLDPDYNIIQREMHKNIEAASRNDQPDWLSVIDRSKQLLKTRGKNLNLVCWLTTALFHREGYPGLAAGLVLARGLVERFWEGLHPQAEEGRWERRCEVLELFLDDLAWRVDYIEAKGLDAAREVYEAARALEELERALRKAFGAEEGPLFAKVWKAMTARLQQVGPAPEERAERKTIREETPDESEINMEAVEVRLRDLALWMQREDPGRTEPYGLVRTLAWASLNVPEPDDAGRLSIDGLASARRAEIHRLAREGSWPKLLSNCESAILEPGGAAWLDLQRYAWTALKSDCGARDLILSMTRSLLARFPYLPESRFIDDTPVADPLTRAWIEEEVLESIPEEKEIPPIEKGRPPEEGVEGIWREAETFLRKGDTAAAFTLIHESLEDPVGRRESFALRLRAAELCARVGERDLARCIFRGLTREVGRYRLEEWEPNLANRLYIALGSEGWEGGGPMKRIACWAFDRLCRSDLRLAAETHMRNRDFQHDNDHWDLPNHGGAK